MKKRVGEAKTNETERLEAEKTKLAKEFKKEGEKTKQTEQKQLDKQSSSVKSRMQEQLV